VIETSHFLSPIHSLTSLQVWSKPVCNKGHFTLDADIVLPPHLVPALLQEAETAHRALSARDLQAVVVWSISVSNKGHITLGEKQSRLRISTRILAG
jgi:hypothetical protein